MKILLCSYSFAPSIGGIEEVSRILAEEFVAAGHEVTVITETVGSMKCGYTVLRRPNLKSLIAAAFSSDIVFQNNISLKTLIPLIWLRRPIVIAHHTWIARVDGAMGWQDVFKRLLIKCFFNVVISQALGKSLPIKSLFITNPFQANEFEPYFERSKNKDIIFIGRLVSDKGCDLILLALAKLKQEGFYANLTVVGDGPERGSLERQALDLGIAGQVSFLGSIGKGRGAIAAEHKVMVVPSRWAEPFGIVALEGIAAGCALVVSSRGGLTEAIGPCGLVFETGNANELALSVRRVLMDEPLRASFMAKRTMHLNRFRPHKVAAQYLNLFEKILRLKKGKRHKNLHQLR